MSIFGMNDAFDYMMMEEYSQREKRRFESTDDEYEGNAKEIIDALENEIIRLNITENEDYIRNEVLSCEAYQSLPMTYQSEVDDFMDNFF